MSESNLTKNLNGIQFAKKYLPSMLFFSLIILFFWYQFYHGVFTNESQFDYAESWIKTTKFECAEGFDGVTYGYTGEIYYRHGFLGGSPTLHPLIPNTLSSDDRKILVEMWISKLEMLPCYEKYLEIGEQQSQGNVVDE